jgi:hypothetical protein
MMPSASSSERQSLAQELTWILPLSSLPPGQNFPRIAHAEGKGQDAATIREVCHCIAEEVGLTMTAPPRKPDRAAAYDGKRLYRFAGRDRFTGALYERCLKCRNLEGAGGVCERVGAAGGAPLPVRGARSGRVARLSRPRL